MLWARKASTRPAHFSCDFGGVTLPFHQKIVFEPLASAFGMNDSSTNGRTPASSRKSWKRSTYCQL